MVDRPACLAAPEKTVVLKKVHEPPVYHLLKELTHAACQSNGPITGRRGRVLSFLQESNYYGRLWNLTLATYNVRTLSSEGNLAVLLEELSDVKWDIIGLSDVRRPGVGFKELNSGHILCYRGPLEWKEHGVGFLIHRDIAGNVEEFYSTNERVAVVVIKLNKKYRLKIVQVYAPTASYDDEVVDSFNEDIESAIKKGYAQFTFVMGAFNAKVGKKQLGDRSVGNSGIEC